MYRQTHGVKLANFPLTHTYCPPCFTLFIDTLRRYRREMGSSPCSCSPALRGSTPPCHAQRILPGTGPREGTVSPGILSAAASLILCSEISRYLPARLFGTDCNEFPTFRPTKRPVDLLSGAQPVHWKTSS